MDEVIKQNKSKSHEEFSKLLSEDLSKRSFKEQEIVTGTIEEIGKKYVFIDLGLKSSGAIPIDEFKLTKELDSISVGAKCEVLLERLESGKTGEVVVSREKARRAKAWKKLEKAFEANEEVQGVIVSRTKGGFVVNIDSCLAFLPSSQLDLRPLKNYDHLMKVPLTFAIVKQDKRRGNIVVSRRAIIEKARNKDKNKIISKLKEGDIVTGICKNITDWGVFVDISGVDALLHITDCSWSRINKPSELMSLGQSIKVKLTKIDYEKLKISCSIKHLTEDPYAKIIDKYKVGQTYPAVVTKVQDYGVFAKLEDGLEGLIHQSQLSHVKRNIHPGKILSTSQKISVVLLEKDIPQRRLSLSYKDTQINPWKKFTEEYKVGGICSGTVKNRTDFGLFISIKNTELDGLIHYKDLHENEQESELEKYKKNQVIEKIKILEISPDQEKIRLGIKQLDTTFTDTFAQRKVGDILTVVVLSTNPNGINVGVGNKKVSILIKKNQLAKEVENMRVSRFVKGDRLDAIITELNVESRKCVLSIKALEEKQTKEVLKKYKSKDSGGILSDIFDFSKIKTKKQKDKK